MVRDIIDLGIEEGLDGASIISVLSFREGFGENFRDQLPNTPSLLTYIPPH